MKWDDTFAWINTILFLFHSGKPRTIFSGQKLHWLTQGLKLLQESLNVKFTMNLFILIAILHKIYILEY